jgi:hypothetical protein
MVGAFIAYFIFRINIVYIILFSATLGALDSMNMRRTGKEQG